MGGSKSKPKSSSDGGKSNKQQPYTSPQEVKLAKRVFFDIEAQNRGSDDYNPIGRIEMVLFSNTPITGKNFTAFCVGYKKPGEVVKDPSGKPIDVLSYENTLFHRVIPGFMNQFGDLTQARVGNVGRAGTGGATIYPGQRFADENFVNKFGERGILAMANAGEDTNGSQCFLCTSDCKFLQGKHVVFGQVTPETYDVVKKIETYGSESGKTKTNVRIARAGALEFYTDEELAAVNPKKPQTYEDALA